MICLKISKPPPPHSTSYERFILIEATNSFCVRAHARRLARAIISIGDCVLFLIYIGVGLHVI